MMTTTTRLFLVALLVGLLAISSYMLPELLEAKDVHLPAWELADMPSQFGSWRGADVELDEKIREQLLRDANSEVSRAYVDDQSNAVSLHLALFQDLDAGVRHSPINCYRGNGWREIGRETMDLRLQDGGTIPVSLTTWEKEGQRVLVMYWYQLGDHVLFNRWDLLSTRLKMWGQPSWPAMVKVLLQTTTSDADKEKSRERIQAVARYAQHWISQAQHPSNGDDVGGRPSAGPSPGQAEAL